MASCLSGRDIKMFKFCLEKNCKCIELHKNVQKGAEEYTEKKVPNIFGKRM